MAPIKWAISLFPAVLTAGPQLVLRSAQTHRASHSVTGELKSLGPQDLGSSGTAAWSPWHSLLLSGQGQAERTPASCPGNHCALNVSTLPLPMRSSPLFAHWISSLCASVSCTVLERAQPRLSEMGSKRTPATAPQEPPALRPSQTPQARPCLSLQGPAVQQTNRFWLPTGRCQLMKLPHFT